MDTPTGNTPSEEVVEEIQPEPIPSENKPAESAEPILPDGVKERTKEEFDKLKTHNSELKQELETYKNKVSVLDSLKPSPTFPNLSETKVEEVKNELVDENGYVDVNRLNLALKTANDRAEKAEAKANQAEQRVQNFEESEAVKKAHAEFPQLDPHNTEGFDPKFYEAVRNELVSQMMKGGQDLVKAAHDVSSWYQPKVDVGQAKEEAVKEYKTKVSKRDQAGSATVSKGKEIPSNRQELIDRTLKGDNMALFKRLQASGN
jgi:hypothetical protein